MSDTSQHDIVLWGATGFTGRLVADHLLQRHGVGRELSWAIGGRNADKLAALRTDLGPGAADLPIVTGDAADRSSLLEMCANAKVICTTVGPYAEFGNELVAACVETGTDYCDLTGEVQWIRRMIDQHHDAAVASGARIVHAAGFDCIPTDLGTWFTQQQAIEREGQPAARVSVRVKGFSGGVSGGTAASMMNLFAEASADADVRRVLLDPYSLNPPGLRAGPDGRDAPVPTKDPDGQWTAPWMMTTVDSRIIRRSHALLGQPWGTDFRLDERLRTGRGPLGLAKAGAVTGAMAGVVAGGAIGPLRRLVGSVLPDPGTGPDEKRREKGWFDIRFVARRDDGSEMVTTKVFGDRDPGYGSTARMLGEAAACLAVDDLPSTGGILTPAAAMGGALVDRLQSHAGVTFTVER